MNVTSLIVCIICVCVICCSILMLINYNNRNTTVVVREPMTDSFIYTGFDTNIANSNSNYLPMTGGVSGITNGTSNGNIIIPPNPVCTGPMPSPCAGLFCRREIEQSVRENKCFGPGIAQLPGCTGCAQRGFKWESPDTFQIYINDKWEACGKNKEECLQKLLVGVGQ